MPGKWLTICISSSSLSSLNLKGRPQCTLKLDPCARAPPSTVRRVVALHHMRGTSSVITQHRAWPQGTF